MALTKEEQERQNKFNEYVIWRLEMIHTNPKKDPTNFNSFSEWEAVMHPPERPRIKKRLKRNEKT